MNFLKRTKKYSSEPPLIEELVANHDHDRLIKMLEDPDMFFRCDVLVGLGEIGDRKALKAIIKALNDDEQMVRFVAAHELVKIDAPHTHLIIDRAFDESDRRAFQMFSESLVKLPVKLRYSNRSRAPED
jgi:hypothetical protein